MHVGGMRSLSIISALIPKRRIKPLRLRLHTLYAVPMSALLNMVYRAAAAGVIFKKKSQLSERLLESNKMLKRKHL